MVRLNAHQKDLALKLITEEGDSFARDDSDVGCIRDLQLNFNFEDQTPVQKNYVAVPNTGRKNGFTERQR